MHGKTKGRVIVNWMEARKKKEEEEEKCKTHNNFMWFYQSSLYLKRECQKSVSSLYLQTEEVACGLDFFREIVQLCQAWHASASTKGGKVLGPIKPPLMPDLNSQLMTVIWWYESLHSIGGLERGFGSCFWATHTYNKKTNLTLTRGLELL